MKTKINTKKEYKSPEFHIIKLNNNPELQLSYYSDLKFSDEQMTEIFLAFQHGLSESEINSFAKYNMKPEEMKNIRKGLEKK